VAVIAGTGFVNPVGAQRIPDEDDGTVSVDSTRLDGMVDIIEVDASHCFMMFSDRVAAQVVASLPQRRFAHTDDTPTAPRRKNRPSGSP